MGTSKAIPIDDLLRKIERTARIRYIAARRLEYHRRLSGWVIALASLTLILIPLVQATGGQLPYSAATLATVEVGLAIFILVYSIFLSAEDFSLRSYKMLQCGNQLSHLARKLSAMRAATPKDIDYDRANNAYASILNAHENHRFVDYLNDKLQQPEEYFGSLTDWQRRTEWTKAAGSAVFRYVFGFLSYAVFLIFFLLVIGRVLPETVPFGGG